jgi:hypothetical protein
MTAKEIEKQIESTVVNGKRSKSQDVKTRTKKFKSITCEPIKTNNWLKRMNL